ncbi:MAG: hypothetical protein IT177_11625 [Acidobacteria bacterium]|nr:hypothetical protein [Acidobacteriota bacterium]
MTESDVDAIVDALEQVTAPLFERIQTLEAHVRALKAAPPAPRWLGVHRAANEYVPGDLVTAQGGLWLACRATSAKPGTPDSGWSLIVKAGSYGTRDEDRA